MGCCGKPSKPVTKAPEKKQPDKKKYRAHPPFA
jgi:hypothetical protein